MCCRDSCFNSPINRATKDFAAIAVKTEHKAAIDHDARAFKSADDFAVVSTEVLSFACILKRVVRKSFKTYEQAAQSGCCRILDQIIAENRINCGSALEHSVHSSHPLEKSPSKARVA